MGTTRDMPPAVLEVPTFKVRKSSLGTEARPSDFFPVKHSTSLKDTHLWVMGKSCEAAHLCYQGARPSLAECLSAPGTESQSFPKLLQVALSNISVSSRLCSTDAGRVFLLQVVVGVKDGTCLLQCFSGLFIPTATAI